MANLLAILVLLGTPAFVILNGWVLSILWLWFLVPIGLPVISIPLAIGISSIVGVFKGYNYNRDKFESMDEAARALLQELFRPFITLMFGWIVTLFM